MGYDDVGEQPGDYEAKPKSSKETNIGALLIKYNSRGRNRGRLEQGPVATPKKFGAQIKTFDPEIEAMLGMEV